MASGRGFYDLCEVDGGIQQVCCSSAYSDQYPPSNLINNRKAKSKEFMAESFVRGPVCLSFHLADNLSVTLIQVEADTEVGNQATNVVGISGCNSVFKGHNICTSGKTDIKPFITLGKGSASMGHIAFVDRYDRNPDNIIFRSKKTCNVVKNIRTLQVILYQCQGIPCLKNLKIFVKPNNDATRKLLDKGLSDEATNSTTNSSATSKNSDSNTTSITNKVSDSYNVRATQNIANNSNFNFYGGSEVSSTNEANQRFSTNNLDLIDKVSERLLPDDQNIPKEFLDEITSEVMAIPMVLPSGKVVDRSTIDKCNQSQAVYGGLSRDPFSGTVYSSTSKPVFNASLKSRIDEYVSQHQVTLHSGQTLGDARSIEEFIRNKHNPLKRKLSEQ